jgi:chemotaxis protein histidine kinase CheA
MRPWAHLVERLNQRTAELHDFVHYPSAAHTITSEEHIFLEKRVAQLEKALSKIKSKMTHATEDVYEYVDDAVDAVEHAMRKQERKWDKYEDKVKEVEQVVVKLSTQPKDGGVRALIAGDVEYLKMLMSSMTKRLVPSWIIWSVSENAYRQVYGSASPNSSATSLLGAHRLRPLPGQPSPSPSRSPTPLETIVEEDPIYMKTKSSLLAKPYQFIYALIYRIGYMVTTPLRAVARMVLRNY